MSKNLNPFIVNHIERIMSKIYKDGGTTDDTWETIVQVYKKAFPDRYEKDRANESTPKIEKDIPVPDEFLDDIPDPKRFEIDHDGGEILIKGLDHEEGFEAIYWVHFAEIEEAVNQIRRECKLPNYATNTKLKSQDKDLFSFLDDDNNGFSIPSDFEGSITIASTKKIEEMKNEVKLLEASENLHLAKIRCLEKRIKKLEK